MRVHGKWLSRAGLLAAALLTCVCFECKNCAAEPEPAASEQDGPDGGQHRVYVFMLHGLDPFDFANMHTVRGHVRSLGFCKTTFGQFFDADDFRKEINRIHQAHPNARFAVIGFSRGARAAHDMVNDLRADGVTINLLVYLDGKGLTYISDPRLDNVERTVNVRARGLVLLSPRIEGAENMEVPVWHYSSPTYPGVLKMLTQELTQVATFTVEVLPAKGSATDAKAKPPAPR